MGEKQPADAIWRYKPDKSGVQCNVYTAPHRGFDLALGHGLERAPRLRRRRRRRRRRRPLRLHLDVAAQVDFCEKQTLKPVITFIAFLASFIISDTHSL